MLTKIKQLSNRWKDRKKKTHEELTKTTLRKHTHLKKGRVFDNRNHQVISNSEKVLKQHFESILHASCRLTENHY